jgi:hypothetical protein
MIIPNMITKPATKLVRKKAVSDRDVRFSGPAGGRMTFKDSCGIICLKGWRADSVVNTNALLMRAIVNEMFTTLTSANAG